MDEPRHGNPEPWQHQQPPPGYGPQVHPGYAQQYPMPVAPPPKRPNHVLHLILTVLTLGIWSSVWIVLTARYWNVVDYRNPRERSGMARRTGIAVGALVAVGVVGGIAAGNPNTGTPELTSAAHDTSTTPAAAGKATRVAADEVDATEEAAATKAPAAKPKPKPKAKPKVTVAQRQAVLAAQSYVETMGFSRAGLIRQLTSSAGSGFERADALYAVNHIRVDWYAEAVESAESYMQIGGFSRASLIQQLTSSAGSGFTLKQAKYAVKKVGL